MTRAFAIALVALGCSASSASGVATDAGDSADGDALSGDRPAPEVVLTSIPAARDLILNVDTLYLLHTGTSGVGGGGLTWTGALHRLRVGSTSLETMLSGNTMGQALGLASGGGKLLWISSFQGSGMPDQLMRATFSGGEPTTLATGSFNSVAVVGTTVFAGGTDFVAVPVNGGEVKTVSGAGMVQGLATDGKRVFASGNGVYAIDPATLSATSLVPASTTFRIAADATDVYFTTAGTSTTRLQRVSNKGGAPVLVASITGSMTRIAVDGEYVYFATSTGKEGEPLSGTLERVPRTGGVREVLAKGAFVVSALAFDAETVWFARVDGSDAFSPPASLWRVRK